MKKLSRILAIVFALCLLMGVSALAVDADVHAAYVEYIHEWLLAEDAANDTMTSDIVENEFMPLVEAGDYVTFPAEMLFNGMLNNGSPMTEEEFAAQYTPAAAAEPAASGEPSGEPSAEPAPAEETVTIGSYTFTVYTFDGEQYVKVADLTEVLAGAAVELEQYNVEDLEASTYYTLTNYTNRDDTGNIILGYAYVDGAASDEANFEAEGNTVVLNQEVTGPAYTAVFADSSEVNVTGKLVATDDTSGELANDFNGIGSLIVAYDESVINVENAEILTDGFDRSGFIVSQNSIINVKDSYVESLGSDPIRESYDEYANSANQNMMLSPPWVLGISGGSRVLNMIGQTPTFNAIDSELVSGGWALLSTDSGSNMMINVVDTEMYVLPQSEGGLDSGWRIFGYDEDAYGTGYGSYYIGNPTQNYYGATFDGVTYAAIITGANSGLYTSSEGEIEIYDANGNLLEVVEGEGNPTVINGVFGIMMHNSLSNGMTFNKGTTFNTEDAIIIYKAGNGDFYFDEAVLNSNNGVLFQMIDNDDDSRVGMANMQIMGFDTVYNEDKVASGIGFPGINYDYASGVGGNTLTATYTNGTYEGNIYNGTGYYGQKGDDITVTIGEGAILNGDIALTSTIKGIPYSEEAMEGIAYYGDHIGYVLLDAEGKECDEADAAYIQIRSYTEEEYFLQGHVQNKLNYNGASTIEVVVAADGVWNVAGESLITGLTIEEGATVKGALTENADGSLTIKASDDVIAAGEYGSIEAVGGGVTIGGGLDASGELNVGAAAEAMASEQASGEPSGEPSAEPAAAPAAADTSEAAYQEYLVAFVMSCEDILTSGAEQEFIALIEAGDYVSFPVEMLFNAQWFGEAAMTYDEFVAAGGVYEIVDHLSNGQMLDGTSA